jgi:hypothetical protein
VVCVFARKTSEPLASLVKQIDGKIGENGKLKSFVVILSRKESTADDLRKLAKEAGIKHVPLTMHGDPGEVPNYEISREADVTVVMWSGHEVKVARGYKGELTEENIKSIVADIPKVLGNYHLGTKVSHGIDWRSNSSDRITGGGRDHGHLLAGRPRVVR